MRNVGGSFGISMGQTALAEFAQRHQTHLVEHLTPYDQTYRQIVPRIAEQVGAPPDSARAFAALMHEVHRQAAMLSYVEIFYLLAWASAILIPLVFLMKAAKPGEVGVAH